jgi:hypothetical protein
VLRHPWSRRLDTDFVVHTPTGQLGYTPVWQRMMECVRRDLREACSAYASAGAAAGHFVDFGWSMPHLQYCDVMQVRAPSAALCRLRARDPCRMRMRPAALCCMCARPASRSAAYVCARAP